VGTLLPGNNIQNNKNFITATIHRAILPDDRPLGAVQMHSSFAKPAIPFCSALPPVGNGYGMHNQREGSWARAHHHPAQCDQAYDPDLVVELQTVMPGYMGAWANDKYP
jgi:hypothetical protein